MWIKNTLGKKDAMLTFALIAFLVTTANVLLSTIGSFSAGTFEMSFQALDAAVMSTYLGISFSAYVGRRWTDTKYTDGSEFPPESQESERGYSDYDNSEEQDYSDDENREPPPSLS